jgi:hypothetical protein
MVGGLIQIPRGRVMVVECKFPQIDQIEIENKIKNQKQNKNKKQH